MPTTPTLGHALRIVDDQLPATRRETPLSSADRAARLGLSPIDQLSLRRIATGDVDSLINEITESARSLAGDDRDEARMRLVARSIATAKAEVSLYGGIVADAVARRDEQGVALAERALNSANKRLVALLAEHRASCAGEKVRTPVLITTDTVRIGR